MDGRASRPGNGARPGRKYRVRRADLDTFVTASQHPPASPEVGIASETMGTSAGLSHSTGQSGGLQIDLQPGAQRSRHTLEPSSGASLVQTTLAPM